VASLSRGRALVRCWGRTTGGGGWRDPQALQLAQRTGPAHFRLFQKVAGTPRLRVEFGGLFFNGRGLLRERCCLLRERRDASIALDDVCPTLSACGIAVRLSLLLARFGRLHLRQGLLAGGEARLSAWRTGSLGCARRLRRWCCCLLRRWARGRRRRGRRGGRLFCASTRHDEQRANKEPEAVASFHVLTKPWSWGRVKGFGSAIRKWLYGGHGWPHEP